MEDDLLQVLTEDRYVAIMTIPYDTEDWKKFDSQTHTETFQSRHDHFLKIANSPKRSKIITNVYFAGGGTSAKLKECYERDGLLLMFYNFSPGEANEREINISTSLIIAQVTSNTHIPIPEADVEGIKGVWSVKILGNIPYLQINITQKMSSQIFIRKTPKFFQIQKFTSYLDKGVEDHSFLISQIRKQLIDGGPKKGNQESFGNEGQSTSSSRNSSDGKSYLLPETLEENVTSILNEQRDLQKVINLLQVIKQHDKNITFVQESALESNYFGSQFDNGTFGKICYCREPNFNMGDHVIKIFNEEGESGIREVYCLWLLQGCDSIATITKIVESYKNGVLTGVYGYVLPHYNKTLKTICKDLKVFKKKKQLSSTEANQVWKILNDIAEGIHFMHKKKVAHLDLCDVNIMVNTKNEIADVKIIDFGSARLFGREEAHWLTPHKEEEFVPNLMDPQQSHKIKIVGDVGHVTYKSPELFTSNIKNKEKWVDPTKADVWAFGVLVYETICMEIVWKGSFERSALKNIVTNPDDVTLAIRKLPLAWQVLLYGCWDIDPETRWDAEKVERFLRVNQETLIEELEIFFEI